jgi:hypothetical protein
VILTVEQYLAAFADPRPFSRFVPGLCCAHEWIPDRDGGESCSTCGAWCQRAHGKIEVYRYPARD